MNFEENITQHVAFCPFCGESLADQKTPDFCGTCGKTIKQKNVDGVQNLKQEDLDKVLNVMRLEMMAEQASAASLGLVPAPVSYGESVLPMMPVADPTLGLGMPTNQIYIEAQKDINP